MATNSAKRPRGPKDSEGFVEFLKKETMPKELRHINPELLQIQTNQNKKGLEAKIQTVTEEQKEVLKIKYDLKKMSTRIKDISSQN